MPTFVAVIQVGLITDIEVITDRRNPDNYIQ